MPSRIKILFNLGADIVDLGEVERIVLVGPGGEYLIVRVVVFLAEPLVVWAGHPNVNVIIPGDESFVTDGAQQRSVGQIIPEPFFFAEPLHILQDIHHMDAEFGGGNFSAAHSDLFF